MTSMQLWLDCTPASYNCKQVFSPQTLIMLSLLESCCCVGTSVLSGVSGKCYMWPQCNDEQSCHSSSEVLLLLPVRPMPLKAP